MNNKIISLVLILVVLSVSVSAVEVTKEVVHKGDPFVEYFELCEADNCKIELYTNYWNYNYGKYYVCQFDNDNKQGYPSAIYPEAFFFIDQHINPDLGKRFLNESQIIECEKEKVFCYYENEKDYYKPLVNNYCRSVELKRNTGYSISLREGQGFYIGSNGGFSYTLTYDFEEEQVISGLRGESIVLDRDDVVVVEEGETNIVQENVFFRVWTNIKNFFGRIFG